MGVRVLLVVELIAENIDDIHGVVRGPFALNAPVGVDDAV
jgi:hypothetical protein